MKRLLKGTLILACTFLLMTGCAKDEQIKGLQDIGDQTVTFTVGLENTATKAAADKDGQAAKVNHWIMEVRDSGGDVFNRQEESGTTGETAHTFTVRLVKGQDYTVLFWADNDGGYYDTSDLTDVKLTNTSTYTANLDERDAFSAVKSIASATALTESVKLYRPFAQLNIIFTDLKALYQTIGDDTEYAKFKPNTLTVKAKVPTSFNVKDQKCGDAATTALTITADSDYLNNYDSPDDAKTIFMDYFFATSGSKDVVDIDFSFISNGVTTSHSFTAVPFQRNYRTNISGELMTAGATWNVTVAPAWNDPDYDVPYMETSSISTAQSYIAPATSGTQEAKVIKIREGAVTTKDVKEEQVEGFTVVEFVLKSTSPKEVSFVLPAVGDNADAWYVSYETGYPTENVAINAPEGTKVIVNAPDSHVKVTGTSYARIIASTNENTLEIPAGCTVDKLVVKEGGLEIHGTVNEVSVEGTTDNVFVRECEGLSESVYEVLKGYIAKGYEGIAQGTTPETYNIVLTSEDWSDYSAKSFSQMDENAKTINILSEAEFALFANNVNTGTTYNGWTITLGNALDMSGHKWTPIGNFTDTEKGDTAQFMGTFDGKSLSISGLEVYSKDKKGVGVFGKVYAPCVLKNINVVNAVVTAEGTNTYTGGLVGHGYATIENCSFQGTVNGGNQMGGIAASGGFTIRNCTFDGTINGKYWGIGGIIGNCQDGGEISGNTAKGSIVGVLADCTDPFIGGGIIGCAIYTSYNVKNNHSAMQISFNGNPQTGFPVVGVYNIDAPGSGNEDFSKLLTSLADNTWNKSIFTDDEYVIYYNTNAPASAGYMLNFGAATTQIEVAKIGDTVYGSLNAALAAVKEGETIILGKNVTDTPSSVGAIANVNGKSFTIRGVDQALSVLMCGNGTAGGEGACDYRLEGASVTFENLTFAQFSGDANYLGFVRPSKLTFDGCTFKGRTSYWGNDCTIKNSTFEHADAYDYCMWTWGCASMTIQNTVFNTQGKAVKMYGAGTCTLNVEGCTFNSNGQHSGADKPAIAINTGDYTTDYTVNITNCTQTGFVAGATGSAIFGSDLLTEVQGNLDVYVDGVQVWKNGASVQ